MELKLKRTHYFNNGDLAALKIIQKRKGLTRTKLINILIKDCLIKEGVYNA